MAAKYFELQSLPEYFRECSYNTSVVGPSRSIDGHSTAYLIANKVLRIRRRRIWMNKMCERFLDYLGYHDVPRQSIQPHLPVIKRSWVIGAKTSRLAYMLGFHARHPVVEAWFFLIIVSTSSKFSPYWSQLWSILKNGVIRLHEVTQLYCTFASGYGLMSLSI